LSSFSIITSPCLRWVPGGRVKAISVPLSEVFLILTRCDSNLLIFIVSQTFLVHISTYFSPIFLSFLIFPTTESIVINFFYLLHPLSSSSFLHVSSLLIQSY